MVQLSRRFFLGGAISLVAATTFPIEGPSLGNLPVIVGDGEHDDTGGIAALLRNEPVVFKGDGIGVDSHRGITIHRGRYKITQTIEVPSDAHVVVEGMTLSGEELPDGMPFFSITAVHRLTFVGTRGELRFIRAHGNAGPLGRTLFVEEWKRTKQLRQRRVA